MTHDLHTVTVEIRENLYGLRCARERMAESIARGDHIEGKRHDDRRWKYAQTIRNIIQGRGAYGPDAYRFAQKELPL